MSSQRQSPPRASRGRLVLAQALMALITADVVASVAFYVILFEKSTSGTSFWLGVAVVSVLVGLLWRLTFQFGRFVVEQFR
jgi:hypothetical protein